MQPRDVPGPSLCQLGRELFPVVHGPRGELSQESVEREAGTRRRVWFSDDASRTDEAEHAIRELRDRARATPCDLSPDCFDGALLAKAANGSEKGCLGTSRPPIPRPWTS